MARLTKARIERLFKRYVSLHGTRPRQLLPFDEHGKLYEARALAWLCGVLNRLGYRIILKHGRHATLRWNGGYLDRRYSFFEVIERKTSTTVGEIWSDIWFYVAQSHSNICLSKNAHCAGDYKEADIVLVLLGSPDRKPICHEQILLAIECKARKKFSKNLFVELVGLRTLMSSVGPGGTNVLRWPTVPSGLLPPSVLLALGTDKRGIRVFKASAKQHLIDLRHLKY